MRKWTSKIIAAFLLFGVIAIVVMAFSPKPVEVETARVIQGHFEQTVEEEGKTRVRERFVISAPLAGQLLRIQLDAGDAVKQGGLLAVMIPAAPPLLDLRTERELRERLGAAEAEQLRAGASVERAQAALHQARSDLKRTRQLAQEGLVSAAEQEQRELAETLRARELEAAQFESDVAGHQVDLARAALIRAKKGAGLGERLEIRSPVNGQVLRVLQESEGPVPLGAPLLEIADPADLEVVADILTTDAVGIRPGMPVRIVRYGGEASLEGSVRRVEPSAFTKVSALGVEEQRVNAIIDLVSPREEWQRLGDGFRVEVQTLVFIKDDAVMIPSGALFREGNGWATFEVSEGRARKRTVQVGRRSGAEAMIEGGLSPGQQVIVYPSDAVKEGVKVKLR
ncbi:MAG: HlyD family efflux transporter periplasmic adaptor subunit [Candidatus Manganitrophaceae bacterium]